MNIKEYNKDLRPYEKFIKYGPQALSDSELLAIIIRTGSKEKNSIELANSIINMSKTKSILGVHDLSIEELMKIKGIGKVKAIEIKAVAELSKRLSKARVPILKDFVTPEIIADYYMEEFRHYKREHLLLIMLNTKHRFIDDFELSKGTVNASLASPREAFIEALNKQAVYIILLHNHPSGDPTPSREDVFLTRRMKKAGDILGISLSDHIIIGDGIYCSLKEKGLFWFY